MGAPPNAQDLPSQPQEHMQEPVPGTPVSYAHVIDTQGSNNKLRAGGQGFFGEDEPLILSLLAFEGLADFEPSSMSRSLSAQAICPR